MNKYSGIHRYSIAMVCANVVVMNLCSAIEDVAGQTQ